VVTSAVHVQIGALVAVVCVLAVVAVGVLERRWWWWPFGGAVISSMIVVTILRLRPVAAQPNDFVQICREVIPFHCDAPTWSAGQLFSGFSVAAAALLTVVFLGRRDGGLWTAVVVAPSLGLTIGVLANRFGAPVLGRVAQTTNIFRLAVLVLPFGAWGLIAGFTRISRGRRAVWLVPAAVAGFGWLEPKDGETPFGGRTVPALVVLAMAAAVIVVLLLAGRRQPTGVPPPATATGGTAGGMLTGALALLPVVTLLAAAALTGVLRWRPLQVTFVGNPTMRAMGELIAAHVPAGQVVEAPPSYGMIRLAAGRSLLVDCKAVPYGGVAWQDYQARLDALGGRGACSHGGRPYLDLSAESLLATARRYDARYVVLAGHDYRSAQIVDDGWQVLARPHPRYGNIWLFAAPGAPDAAGANGLGPDGSPAITPGADTSAQDRRRLA
jgi:hypothetical protein